MKSAVARIVALLELLGLAALWMTTVSLVSISPAGTVTVAPPGNANAVGGGAAPAPPTAPVVPLPAPPQPVGAPAVPLAGGVSTYPERQGVELPGGQMVCDCKPAAEGLPAAVGPTPMPSSVVEVPGYVIRSNG